MQKNFLRGISALFACLAMLAPIGCGGGGSNSTGGGGGGGGTTGGGTTTTYTLGGTLSGLATNQSVALQDNGGNTLSLAANGPFSFTTSLDNNSAYAITVQSHTPGVACAVTGGSGTVNSANVSSIDVTCAPGTETPSLYSFGATAKDGRSTLAGVIIDSAGNLYGTTNAGGANGFGTVFKLSSTGTETVLYSFGATATDGEYPLAGLIMDSAGNLYGTTSVGGADSEGMVFKLSSNGTLTNLHSFGAGSNNTGTNANDGQNPRAVLVMDSAGNLYGTTANGGANSKGTVFTVSSAGAESVLYSFGASANDAQTPFAGLIMDSSGNLYGTTEFGGVNSKGTVFKLSNAVVEGVLYSFGTGPNDGSTPLGGLVIDSAGNLYGTTQEGGANGNGTVFKLSSTGSETLLHSFGAGPNNTGTNATDGKLPNSALIMDSAGNLYGTTQTGGANTTTGTVFTISAAGVEGVLYSFGKGSDGVVPYAGLIMDSAGNLYGTTETGGTHGEGTVFEIN